MLIHFHYSSKEASGEIRRIRNININLAAGLSDKIIECAFISIKDFVLKRRENFVLSNRVTRKFFFPTFPFSNSKLWAMRVNSVWTSFIIRVLVRLYNAKYVIGEYSAAWQSARYLPKDVKFIVDVHGALREEYEYDNNNVDYRIAEYYDYLESKSVSRSTYVICQSREMKRHLLSKYPTLSSEKIYPYACHADLSTFNFNSQQARKTRELLGLADEQILFVYSGGLHKWQNVDKSLSYFDEFHKYYPSSRFLLLTGQLIQANELIDNSFAHLREAVFIKSAPHSQVPDYLNASNVGFLIRDNVVMNAVAYPTKLAEYMACGLPVISTNVSSHWLNDTQYIYNIENNDIVGLYEFLIDIKRYEVSGLAHKELSLDTDNIEIERLLKNERSE